MPSLRGQQAGGRARAISLRQEALDRYYANPNICEFCKKIIQVREGEKLSLVRCRKFCNSSCSSRHNNPIVGEKRTKNKMYLPKKSWGTCGSCGKGTSKKHAGVCQICKKSRFYLRSKGDLFANRANWQSARSGIQRHARNAYIQSPLTQKSCYMCGYERHYEVCHIKSVSDFPDDALIGEINSISNLVALCPTHHWEFDNGYLSQLDFQHGGMV